jgi:hypothetical protein
MITVTSNSLLPKEGFVNDTVFTFTVDGIPAGSSFVSVNYVWGDGTKNDFKTTTAKKSYKLEKNYKIKATVYYTTGKKSLNKIEYIDINVKKIPSKSFLITRTVRNETDKNYSRVTKFTFTPNPDIFGTDASNLKYVQWNFGNGVLSNRPIVDGVTFDSAGVFKVEMIAYTKANIKYEYSEIVIVEEYINDSIRFSKVPPPTYAGHLNRFPFEIEVTYSITSDTRFVDLYCQFSKSLPTLDVPTKYSFLRPQWRFLDTSLNVIKEARIIKDIDPIKVNEYGEEIKNIKVELPMVDGSVSVLYSEEYKNGITVGTKGRARFYFVDDWYNQDQVISNEQYTVLWATLRSQSIRDNQAKTNIDGPHPSHANNTAQTYVPYVTLWREPETIKFTRNGVNRIPPIQWQGSDIPFIASVGYLTHQITDPHNLEASIRLADRIGGFAHYIPINKNEEIPLNIVFSSNFSTVSSFLKPQEVPVIKYKDSNNFLTGGYYKSTYEQKNASTINLSASLSFNKPSLEANNYNPNLWLLNPTNGDVNIAQYVFTNNSIIDSPQYFYFDKNVDTYNDLFLENKVPLIGSVKTNPNMDTAVLWNIKTDKKTYPHISSIYDNKKGLTGLHSVASLNFPTYHAWVSDVELDKIYRITSDGKIYKTIDLKTIKLDIPNLIKYTPDNLVIDGNLNLFVGLSNAGTILKFNDNGQLTGILKLDNIIPVCIDTDKDNNLYISGIYKNQTKKSVLLKYNNTLKNQLNIKEFNNIFLGNILVSPNNNIYVINEGHINKSLSSNYENNCFIEIFNTTNFQSVKKLSIYPYLKHMVLDKNDNLYFTHSYGKITKVSPKYTVLKEFEIKTNKVNDKINKSIIEGLSYNINERIYILNSLENKVHVLNASNLKEESFFFINPSNIEYEVDSEGQLKTPYNAKYSNFSKSLIANGDFNGWKWCYKYSYTTTTNTLGFVSGRSGNISFKNDKDFKFFAKNENFDMGKYMYDFSFMRSLKESPFLYNNKFYDAEILSEVQSEANTKINSLRSELNNIINSGEYDKNNELVVYLNDEINKANDDLAEIRLTRTNKKGFIGSIFGSYPYRPNDLGVSTFSKIANFVDNTADIDTCDIKHLYDMMSKIDFQDESFKVRFPEGISRIVDFASISPNKLMGVKCKCGDTFTSNEYGYGICSYCGKEKQSNRGKLIDTLYYNVTAGIPIVLKYKNLDKKYRKLSTGIVDNQNIYSITQLATSIGLPEEWRVDYQFYEYKPTSDDFSISNNRFISAFNTQQLTAFYSKVNSNSAEILVTEIEVPLVSSINYTITSFAEFNTESLKDWYIHIEDLKTKTILNFNSSYSVNLSSAFYYIETSALSIPITDLYLLDNTLLEIKNYKNYKKHNFIVNKLSAIQYKQFIKLNEKYRTENFIDWNNPQTTIPINQNQNAWYASNGIFERMINYELQKGLGII